MIASRAETRAVTDELESILSGGPEVQEILL